MLKGFTTGTTAAGAAKAAAMMLLTATPPPAVDVTIPSGHILTLNVKTAKYNDKKTVTVSIIKDAGSDPDVTNAIEIEATVCLNEVQQGVFISGGRGVGVVTKPGLQVPPGSHAINPVPISMITHSIREVIPNDGVNVAIAAIGGEDIAQLTFNPRLGILGGISIIGTKGIVEPMSVDAIRQTIKCEVDVSFEEDNGLNLYVAPGKIGEAALCRIFGAVRVIHMSNFVGFTLGYAKKKGVQHLIIGGHPGKLAKILMGYMDTHSKNSPQATNFVADFLSINGQFNTVEQIIELNQVEKFNYLAYKIAEKIVELFSFKSVAVYLFDMKKSLIGKGYV
ncbi:MAG: cobalt-precorrin-5B (C(1))-methyltransferase CbiD [Candidatus Magnetoovum sp. WYHC-5]|nr:cobalt-precorrin-5B (C(1))-methyltransferase CbiD [Candidatus Magnetoovum sp. WYHC-5]